MKVLGIIPARYASSRFPGKPLIDLKGKTMIQRVYEGARKSKLIDLLIVATDDTRIRDEVLRFGGNVEMTSEKHNSGTDRCAEVAKKYPEYDLIVNIQGDEPLVDFRQLDQLIQVFEKESIQIATLATRKITREELENPNRIKIVVDKNNSALYFSRSAIPNQLNFTFLIAEKVLLFKSIRSTQTKIYFQNTIICILCLKKLMILVKEFFKQAFSYSTRLQILREGITVKLISCL